MSALNQWKLSPVPDCGEPSRTLRSIISLFLVWSSFLSGSSSFVSGTVSSAVEDCESEVASVAVE